MSAALTAGEIALWRELAAAARAFHEAQTIVNAERVSRLAVKAHATPYPPGEVAPFRPLVQLGMGLAGRPAAERKDRAAALAFAADWVDEALDALPAPAPPAAEPDPPYWVGGGK